LKVVMVYGYFGRRAPFDQNTQQLKLAITDPFHERRPLRSSKSKVRPGGVIRVTQYHSTIAEFSYLHTIAAGHVAFNAFTPPETCHVSCVQFSFVHR
jgi:hypothetical protein